MIADTDTSSQTVNWTLVLLANRPKIQAKVNEEPDRVIGPDALPTVEYRTRLPYIFACLAEPMRYRTIGPLGLPHKASEDTEIGGYLIPCRSAGSGQHLLHPPRSGSLALAPRIHPGAVPASGQRLCVSGANRQRLHPLRVKAAAAAPAAASPRQRCGSRSRGCCTSYASTRPAVTRCRRTRRSGRRSRLGRTRWELGGGGKLQESIGARGRR